MNEVSNHLCYKPNIENMAFVNPYPVARQRSGFFRTIALLFSFVTTSGLADRREEV
jgi:hypothetical protein